MSINMIGKLATIFLIILLAGFALAETVEGVKGEILDINEEGRFIVINLGKNKGVDIGNILNVYRDDQRIAEMQVLRARDDVAATEIISIKPGASIKAGDTVILLPKRIRSIFNAGEREKRKEVKEVNVGDGLACARQGAPSRLSKEKVKEVNVGDGLAPSRLSNKKEAIKAVRDKIMAKAPDAGEKGKAFANIDADNEKVWFYLIQALRDYGFMITDSNKTAGLLTARKNLEISLAKEIWADIRGGADYEAVLWVTTIPRKRGVTYLAFDVNGSYKRGGKYRQFRIKRRSKVYREIGEIIQRIKEQAER